MPAEGDIWDMTIVVCFDYRTKSAIYGPIKNGQLFQSGVRHTISIDKNNYDKCVFE